MQFGQLKFQWNLDPSFVSLTLSPITYFFFEEPFRYWWCTVPHSHVLNQKLSSSHFIAQSLSLSLTCNQSHWQNLLCCDTHTLPVPFYQIFDIYLAPPFSLFFTSSDLFISTQLCITVSVPVPLSLYFLLTTTPIPASILVSQSFSFCL